MNKPVEKSGSIPLVRSIPEKCRVCYTCVRECPAKAIRIASGQAEVIPERCIGCGNCVRVCSQNAKEVRSGLEQVESVLSSGNTSAAILAPSFPVEFHDCEHTSLVGMLRQLGFDFVNEVAFGADLVAREYRKLLSKHGDERYIATSCPAVVSYVEKYHPGLVRHLAPIVSPMIATARVLHALHGQNLKIVFIGPCIAKKDEARTTGIADEIDAVLTFIELRHLLNSRNLKPGDCIQTDFDPPHPGYGMLFPIARGLLETAGIEDSLVKGDIVATDGRENFVEAIKEFETGAMNARLLEVLSCHGCIMGAGIGGDMPLFRRRSLVSEYSRKQLVSDKRAESNKFQYDGIDLSRTFSVWDQRIPNPSEQEIAAVLAGIGKYSPADELNCGACGYETCREHAVAILKGLAENEMCLPYTIEQLKNTVNKLGESNRQLATLQNNLLQTEKLASMGQLAAGIAHEVNNPLGIVLMYAHLLLERCKNTDLHEDITTITEQADRCRKIISGLLNFARQNKTLRQSVNIPALTDHVLKTLSLPDSIRVNTENRMQSPDAEIDRDQITQALVNLISNAVDAMSSGGVLGIVATDTKDDITISVTDSGCGISRENIKNIFEPFFTTKQIGKGTGLGLAVTYGIVKMHSGRIDVNSNNDPANGPTGSVFRLTLPRTETSPLERNDNERQENNTDC